MGMGSMPLGTELVPWHSRFLRSFQLLALIHRRLSQDQDVVFFLLQHQQHQLQEVLLLLCIVIVVVFVDCDVRC